MRILTAIANFGTKNVKYLEMLLEEYRSMTRYKVDIKVLSNIPKDFGPDVEVIVGLPTKDPMSLPFGYKKLFAKHIDDYDLFIYTEDDTFIKQRNIEAFIEVTDILPQDKIAGFLRYERAPNGQKYYSTIHSHYHWEPGSVLRIRDYVFARYTNDHSGCFILTQQQLKKAVESGGFLLPPKKRRYGILETAATDPYAQCGMKKVICISHLQDYCLHHLPNAYCGKIGLSVEIADREIEELQTLPESDGICGPLFETNTLLEDPGWDKKYYEPCRTDILSLIPEGVTRVLSVGCGCGSTEADLVKQGIEVMGIPLDTVIQVTAAANGLKTVNPDFKTAQKDLAGEQFDCIIFMDLLHHLPDPVSTMRQYLDLLRGNGCLIISVPNFNHPSAVRQRMLGKLPVLIRHGWPSFEKYRMHFTTRPVLNLWLEKCGLTAVGSYQQVEAKYELMTRLTLGTFNNALQRHIVVSAKPDETKA